MQEKNTILEDENYFAQYQSNIENLKNQPDVIEFDKLCYELFHINSAGKRFMEIVIERYLMMGLAQRGTPTYQIDVLWQEGFKDAFRIIMTSVKSHEQRIKHEDKKA